MLIPCSSECGSASGFLFLFYFLLSTQCMLYESSFALLAIHPSFTTHSVQCASETGDAVPLATNLPIFFSGCGTVPCRCVSCRCMSMPYQPPWPLPVPSSLTPVPDSIHGLDLASLGLMSSQEEISNDQLQHNVRSLSFIPRLLPCPQPTARWHKTSAGPKMNLWPTRQCGMS